MFVQCSVSKDGFTAGKISVSHSAQNYFTMATQRVLSEIKHFVHRDWVMSIAASRINLKKVYSDENYLRLRNLFKAKCKCYLFMIAMIDNLQKAWSEEHQYLVCAKSLTFETRKTFL